MQHRFHHACVATLFASTALVSPAAAQSVPRFINPDQNGVDLSSGQVQFAFEEGGIGSGPGAMRLMRIWAQEAGWTDNWSGGLYQVVVDGTLKRVVQINGIGDYFTEGGTSSNPTFTADNADGTTLVKQTDGKYLYTASDGTTILFKSDWGETLAYSCPGAEPESCQVPETITRPNGLKFTLLWSNYSFCPTPGCTTKTKAYRLRSVTSSAGYSMVFDYISGIPTNDAPPPSTFYQRAQVQFKNLAGNPNPLPTVTYAYPSSTITDITNSASGTWRLTLDSSGYLAAVRLPGHGSNDYVYVTNSSNGVVQSATRDGVTYTYSRTLLQPFIEGKIKLTVTDPNGKTRQVYSTLATPRPDKIIDELGNTTLLTYDGNGRLDKVTAPEGNVVDYDYDARGNVIKTTIKPKPGTSPLPADIVTSATYDASCTSTNLAKCNSPNTTTDALNNVTDYTYDLTHGGVTSITRPAPTTGAVRPQTRIHYSAVTSQQGHQVTLPDEVSACQTTASCDGTADEVVTTIQYNGNLLPTSTSSGDGTGTLVATTAMTYDPRGNVDTIDGPLPGTADTSKYFYDAIDRRVGAISPDPDGAGTLKNRAVKVTYEPDGRISKAEWGTTVGQTTTAWNAFAPLQSVETYFDNEYRVRLRRALSGTTKYTQSHFTYDTFGRLECQAVRMNPAAFSTIPATACDLGTQGTNGPDRITKLTYDDAGRLASQQVAYETTDAATEAAFTYTANGQVETLVDGENNKTTYAYDGFDRLEYRYYPNTTKGAGTSSTTDFERYAYDAASNQLWKQLRTVNSKINFSYDKLNRLKTKDLPGIEPDVTYAYDNLGRLSSASQVGNNFTFTYDALSRNLTQNGPQGMITSEYDLAGRRTKLTYPGAPLYMSYDYLVTGEMTAIRENGATSGVGVLASFGYDDLGNRTSLTYGNGASTSYSYDPISRLSTLALNMDGSGTANDTSVTFAYNPASQIISRIGTNNGYAYAPPAGSALGNANGLNQLTGVGGSFVTHDAYGNTTFDPTVGRNALYTSENLLRVASGIAPSTTLTYDPLMRLQSLSNSNGATSFRYDGLDMLAEYDGAGTLTRRYVHGPGADEPLVQYDGTGTSSRTFLMADERGSIVALTDSNGAKLAINSYDEYGIPGSGNVGCAIGSPPATLCSRFQYTGQAWVPELKAYYYKARFYSPSLGRFLQTDPIDVLGGINLYAYVGNDAVNLVDPLGLDYCDEHPDEPNCRIVVTGSRITYRGIVIIDVGGYSLNDLAITEFGGGGGGSSSNSQRCNLEGKSRIGAAVNAGGTIFAFGGLSGNIEVGITDLHFNPGTQVYIEISGSLLAGIGAYVGGGLLGGSSTGRRGLSKSGPSRTKIYSGGAAYGYGAEVSGSQDGQSVSVIPEVGLGAYGAAGEKFALTGTSPPLPAIGCPAKK